MRVTARPSISSFGSMTGFVYSMNISTFLSFIVTSEFASTCPSDLLEVSLDKKVHQVTEINLNSSGSPSQKEHR